MRLRSLEIQGFKTFPNRTKLEFLDGISAVVGPNGSGKSNISDAIRWVLGEQSVKMLRCSKMEDVIFSGTQEKKSKGFAEVVLTLEKNDKESNFEEKDITVTRRYYRSGESEYLINNKHVRLKDINELFMDTGLGKDGYSVISQGKIDSIVSAKSDERRELFEEATGISKYRHRRAEANKKLTQSEENLVRIKDVLSELESRVGPLEKQSQKAQKYLEYANERKSLEVGVWLRNLSDLVDFLSDQKVKIDDCLSQKDEVELSLENVSREIDSVFSNSNKIAIQLDCNRKNIESSENEINSIKNKIILLENEIKHNTENIQSFNNEIEEMMLSGKKIKEILDLKRSKVELKKQKIAETNLKLSEKNQNLAEVTEEFQRCMIKYNQKFKAASELEQMLSKNNIDKILCESQIENLNEKKLSCQKSVSNKQTELKELCDELSSKSNDISITNKKLSEISNCVSSQKLLNEKSSNEYKNILQQLNKVEFDLKNSTQKIEMLEEMEKNLEGFSLSVKNILKASKSGNLTGICGTVSSIINVKERCAVAIDVALGAAVQNIVVDTENSAKSAIQFLKSQKVGRATFLPLDVMKGKKIVFDNINKLEGFIGLGSDLCEYDKKYSCVIEYLLGRVIVVDNLDNAVNVSRKMSYKYKVVTLDGQVINTGGSLTGGSAPRKSGTLTRAAEIKKLKSDCEFYSKQKAKLEENLSNLKNELSLINDRINKQIGLQTVEKNTIIRLETEERNLKLKKAVLEKELSLSSEQLRQIGSDIENHKDKINVLELKDKEIKINLENLKFDTNSSQEINDKFLRDKDLINESINALKINIMSMQKEIEAVNSEILSYEQSIESKDKKINELSNKRNTAIEQNENYSKQIADSNDKMSSLKVKIDECKLQDSSLKNDRTNLEKASIELRKKEKELVNSKECIVKDLTLMQERRENFIKKQDDIISKLWDEYGFTKSEAEEFVKPVEDLKASDRRLVELKMKIKSLGTVNLEAVEEFKEVNERYKFLSEQVADIEKSKIELKNIINSLTQDMESIFKAKFKEINNNFTVIFKELFGGGEAELILLNPEDILTTGIEISVKPPGKLVLHLDSLSGGEKALVAIALYFAIMKVNPAPFCVLDEIEAALDDVNVSRFANYLRKINNKTQFVVITHRRGTMEEADVLYGVTMQDDGISKVLELKANKFIDK